MNNYDGINKHIVVENNRKLSKNFIYTLPSCLGDMKLSSLVICNNGLEEFPEVKGLSDTLTVLFVEHIGQPTAQNVVNNVEYKQRLETKLVDSSSGFIFITF